MALTPEQAASLSQADYDEVQKMERELDTKLLTNFVPTKPRLEHPLPGPHSGKDRPKMKILMELARRYEVAGWRVTFVRDGEDIYAVALEATAFITEQPSVHHRLMAKEETTGPAED